MKNLLFTFLAGLLFLQTGHSQGPNRFWFGFTHTVLDFAPTTPVTVTPPTAQNYPYNASAYPGYYPGEDLGAQQTACDALGNLQFFVKILNVPNNGILGQLYPAWPKLFDRYGYSMPNGNINANWENFSEQPVIVAHPGNNLLYYVFYTRNGGLQYSLVDMTLNNGLGDVVPGQKNILISGWGTVNGTKMAAVAGCNAIWLIIRSRTANQYLSYRIGSNGLETQPVISDCGLLSLADYNQTVINDGQNWQVSFSGGGRLTASKDGLRLAAACSKGIELYDFEPCSGKLSHPLLIDTLPFLGVCFSPARSRLYAVQAYPLPYMGQQGQVYQYDLSSDNAAIITGSKTLVLTNDAIACYNPSLNCYCDTLASRIGDLVLGPDDKIYMSNNKRYRNNSMPIAPATTVYPYHALHVIHNPEAIGLACNPQLNAIPLPTSSTYTVDNSNSGSLMFLAPFRVVPKPAPDTIAGTTKQIEVCFLDSVLLHAAEGAECLLWEDGSSGKTHNAATDGTYFVSYYHGCTYTTDTYKVRFIPLPQVPLMQYGCEGETYLTVRNKEGDSTRYRYSLENESGNVLQEQEGNGRYEFPVPGAGNFRLKINTGNCDTTLWITMAIYPAVHLQTSPADTTIPYGQQIRIHASGADLYTWWPSGPLDTATLASPMAMPLKPQVFTVMGWNSYGCRDSGYVRINIDYHMEEFLPNAFSPNGDGLNDRFHLKGILYQKISVFHIFNRYGALVYDGTRDREGWDGNFKGKTCDAGIYHYLVSVEYPDGSRKTYKGNLSLIR